MKIKELIYQTPEMSEEKLLEIIDKNTKFYDKYFKRRIESLHQDLSLKEAILAEWDLIQEKKSFLTRGERDKIQGLVSVCLIKMTKGDEENK